MQFHNFRIIIIKSTYHTPGMFSIIFHGVQDCIKVSQVNLFCIQISIILQQSRLHMAHDYA